MNINDFVKTRTKDLGPLIYFKCPHCQELRWFNLRKHIAAISMLGLDVTSQSTHIIHCVKCDSIIDVPAAETGKAVSFLPVAAQFAAGKMSERDFLARQSAEAFGFLKTFAATRMVWTCWKCGTESAMNLATCWSCGSARDRPGWQPPEPPPEESYEDKLAKYRKGPPVPPGA